jgi:hypothetical protein
MTYNIFCIFCGQPKELCHATRDKYFDILTNSNSRTLFKMAEEFWHSDNAPNNILGGNNLTYIFKKEDK